MKPLIYLLIMAATLSTSQLCTAESSVWKISSDKNTLYLGGTVHMLHKSDHPLPAEFDKAYKKSSVLYFETDVQQANSPAIAQKMLQALMLKDGSSLQSKLKPETYAQLSDYVASRNGQILRLNSFTPSGAAIMLTAMEYMRLGLDPTLGVDMVYTQKAITDKKQLGQLETLDEQLEFIVNMSGGKDDELIAYTLRDLNRLPTYIDDLKEAWREGDLDAMEALALNDLKKEFPDSYDRLIVARNNNWMTKINALMQNKETEFILIGALHLAGDKGLLSQLQSEGYKVDKL